MFCGIRWSVLNHAEHFGAEVATCKLGSSKLELKGEGVAPPEYNQLR